MSRHDDRHGFVFTFPGLGRGADDVLVTPPRDTPPRDGFVRLHPSVASFLVRDWALARDTAADLERPFFFPSLYSMVLVKLPSGAWKDHVLSSWKSTLFPSLLSTPVS